ncbi:UNVERIFIED_CONTAM: hypothetical protein Slati_1412000 [Sesamum latifolium]|uniref:Reverse transcriptase/retrotransposon-derived protein RNase H-like domain-containing protein n=1 Tax=Sesamum latifolium TaxID=2727402 RepID=A0AAW2X8T8_9LAMI
MVTEKGIEVNLEKFLAIQEMRPPTNLNEVQRLAGRIAALSRFISRSVKQSLPFFKALRKNKNFVWNEECQWAFQDLKAYLADLHLPTKPTPGEPLYLYLAVPGYYNHSVHICMALIPFNTRILQPKEI